MFSYIVALIAAVIFLANPISQLFAPSRPHINYAPRPQLNESLLAIDRPDDLSLECPADAYSARILSREPLVIYLENFLSQDERGHLLDISEPIFEPSTVTHDGSSTVRNTTVRDSHVALIPRTPSVKCIERRARALQGWRKDVWIERLRTQKYIGPAGHYSHHFDWRRSVGGWGRVSSFMVWVDDGEGELVGGGTEFPKLRVRSEAMGKDLCRLVECKEGKGEGEEGQDEGEGVGVTFKAKPGNAVYWENFSPYGKGYDETWHAGLPVEKGVKVGLNIWSFGRIE